MKLCAMSYISFQLDSEELMINESDMSNEGSRHFIEPLMSYNSYSSIRLLCGHLPKGVHSFNIQEDIIFSLLKAKLNSRCHQFTAEDLFSDKNAMIKMIDKLARQCRFLSTIVLVNNHIEEQGSLHLKNAQFKFIQRITLSNARINWIGISYIAQCPWKYLKWLDISKNQIKNKGLKALVQKSYWPNLLTLSIERIGITREGIKLLLKNNWPRIQFIKLGKVPVGSEVIDLIAKFPHSSLIRCSYDSKHVPYMGPLFKITLHYDRSVFSYKPIVSNTAALPRNRKYNSPLMQDMLAQRFNLHNE